MQTIRHANFRELVADEGKRLTQAANVPEEARIYVTRVALGKGARINAWTEVDAPEPAADPVED